MATLKIPITSSDHVLGPEDARITLVEYGDYECPFCRRAHGVVKQLLETYRDQILFMFRNFPLSELHPYAEVAAETAEFAGEYGKFWEMHDLIYENQDQLGMPLLLDLVKMIDLPEEKYIAALQQKTFLTKIKSDFMGGLRSGVNGTPTFFINNQRHNGSFDFPAMAEAINSVVV